MPQWRDYAASNPRYPIPSTSSIFHFVGGTGGVMEPWNLPPKKIQFEFTSSGEWDLSFITSSYAGKVSQTTYAGGAYWNQISEGRFAPDGVGAYAQTSSAGLTNYLDFNDFGFNIPSYAVVASVGIKATIVKKSLPPIKDFPVLDYVTDEMVQLIINGSTVGSN